MSRPRKLILLTLFVAVGYAIWRWRQSQAIELSAPAAPAATPPAPAAPRAEATPPAPAAGPRRIVTRVHRGAPPSAPARPAGVTAPEEPPPAPSEPPASHEQSLAPLTPEEVTSSHAEPEPPASHEQSLAPLAPEEVIDAPAPAADAEELGTAAPSEPVNVNSADRQTLIDLPGIGPALADRIIEYREKHGPFGSVDALVRVQGIGPVSLSEFRHLLTV